MAAGTEPVGEVAAAAVLKALGAELVAAVACDTAVFAELKTALEEIPKAAVKTDVESTAEAWEWAWGSAV